MKNSFEKMIPSATPGCNRQPGELNIVSDDLQGF
jgi:hypothetical protein